MFYYNVSKGGNLPFLHAKGCFVASVSAKVVVVLLLYIHGKQLWSCRDVD